MAKRIYFDVGAHDGHSFLHVKSRWRPELDPELLVYAFEPQHDLYARLKRRTSHLPNVKVYNAAVADFMGKATFHVCPDAGCSSLLPFAEGVARTWDVKNPKWGPQRVPGDDRYRTLEHVRDELVEVVMLDAIVEHEGITCIDYLHVDAQGADLAVLKGLGRHIHIVQAGVIEVPASANTALYQDQHTKEMAVQFLEECGLRVESVQPNDPFCLEQNVYFRRT